MKYTKKHNGGRPCTYPNTAEGLVMFRDNTEHFLQSNVTGLNVVRWAAALKLNRASIYNYRHRGAIWQQYIDDTIRIMADRTRSGS